MDRPFLLKADVVGSEQAIIKSLEDLSTADVSAVVIESGLGAISESDIELASLFNATIVTFNVDISRQTEDLLDKAGVVHKSFSVIYDLLDFADEILLENRPSQTVEKTIGSCKVQQVCCDVHIYDRPTLQTQSFWISVSSYPNLFLIISNLSGPQHHLAQMYSLRSQICLDQ